MTAKESRGPVKETALTLRSIRHGESSRIVTLFGRRLGKFAVIAKGARSGRSGAAGAAVDPPGLVEAVVYFKASRNVQTLGQITPLRRYTAIRSDLALTTHAAVVLELLNRSLTDAEPNPEAFDAAVRALERMESGAGDPRVSLWSFASSLIRSIGFELDVTVCPVCGKTNAAPGIRNLLWIDSGGICCPACKPDSGSTLPLSGETVRLLRAIADGASGQTGPPLERLKPSRRAARELNVALERFLRHHHPGIGRLPALGMLERLEESPAT